MVFLMCLCIKEKIKMPRKEKLKSVFIESTESLLSLLGFRNYWTDVCTL